MTDPLVVDFDHHSPAYAADPWGELERVRSKCPVAYSEHHGGFWVLTRYEDISRVVRDDVTFSSRHDVPNDGHSYTGIIIPELSPTRSSFIEMDPPEFLAYRHLLNASFAPSRIEQLKAQMRDITTECIDRCIESGRVDLVYDFSNPVPAAVTLSFVGLPLDQWEVCAEANHALAHTPPDSPAFPAALQQLMAEFDMFRREVQSRRRDPQGDLLTSLVNAEVDGRALTDDDVVEMLGLIVSGGVDTTTSVSACAFHYLDVNREARRQLIEHPELIPSAVEEFLRYFTPNTAMARTVTRDVELGGQQLRAGDRVLVYWAAANHDPAAFDRPEELVLDRFPNKHMSFGLGAHRCIGSNFARAEIVIMVEELLRRMPDYTIDHSNTERYASFGVNNGFVRMPATFTAGSRLGVEHPVLWP